jgi:C_GCAxxG_C_C family probable redox protein
MEDQERMIQLKQQGYFCSQILVFMGLELQGKTNPDLIRAVHALAGGLGFSGDICGALSGGACLLGLYSGKGEPQEAEDPRLFFMVQDLVKWFQNGYGNEYGGVRCEQIIGESMKKQGERCPLMVAGTFQKVKALLVENGFNLSGVSLDD